MSAREVSIPCAGRAWGDIHTFSPQWQLRQNYRYSRNTNDGSYHYADFFTLVGGWGADPVNQRILKRIYSDTRTSLDRKSVV